MDLLLETPRLVLRTLIEDDAEALAAMDNDPEVMRYILAPGQDSGASAEKSREWIAGLYTRYYESHPYFGFWAADLRDTGELIGWFILRPAPDYRFAAEAGWQ